MKKSLSIVVALFLTIATQAQLNHKALYEAYLTGDLTLWGTTLRNVEKQQNPTIETMADAASYCYGYIAYCLDKKDKAAAEHHMTQLKNLCDKLTALHYPDSSTITSYRSSLLAYQCLINKIKMASLGPKALKLSNKAYAMDKKNPVALSLKGNCDFYRPAMFGGDKVSAMKYFRQSVEEFEKQGLTKNNWNYISTMQAMAQAYEKIGNKEEAIKVCRKILSIAPNYFFIKDTYLPQLLEDKNTIKK